MGKSRGRGKSEIESLRGEVRQLKKELKYHRRRAHIEHSIIDEEEIQSIDATQCPSCHEGILVEFDFKYAILKRCSECEYEQRSKKK